MALIKRRRDVIFQIFLLPFLSLEKCNAADSFPIWAADDL